MLAQLKAIVAQENNNNRVRMMVPDSKGGKGFEKKKLSDHGNLPNWAEILNTRGFERQKKGEGLLVFVDNFMAEIDMPVTHNNIYSQKLAIMQAVANFISGYQPGNEILHIAIAQFLTCFNYRGLPSLMEKGR